VHERQFRAERERRQARAVCARVVPARTDCVARREDVLDTSISLLTRRIEQEEAAEEYEVGTAARPVRAQASELDLRRQSGLFLLPIGHKARGNPRRWRVTA
jgi:hypothetical protein